LRIADCDDVETTMTVKRPEVLFVCVHNAGRSQMAAGLVTLRSGGTARVRSGGSDPAEAVNPLAAQVMAEVGVDLADAFPKALTDEAVRAADVVITMGCGDACPIFPREAIRKTGTSPIPPKHLHWMMCGRSAMTSMPAYNGCSRN
jgi:protein-tyrosine-phosphatase